MQPRLITTALAIALGIACGRAAHARLLEDWPYEKLDKHADLVVIAQAVSVAKTIDQLHVEDWKEFQFAGQNTTFEVKYVVAGSTSGQRIKVLHFRFAKTPTLIVNGPLLAKFQLKRDYLLFLKRRGDGRYEPVSGQIDPVLSIRDLSVPLHMVLERDE